MNIRISVKQYSKRGLAALGVLLALFLGLQLVDQALADDGHTAGLDGQKVVNIYDDHNPSRTIVTNSKTVRQALAAAEIEIDEQKDVVEPGLDTELVSTKYNLNIYRARPITVIDGQRRLRVVTARQTPTLIAEAVGVKLFKEDEVTIDNADNILQDGVDLLMKIDRATPVKLTAYGKTTVVRTQAETVAGLLAEKGLKVGKKDTLSVKPETKIKPNMIIKLWRNGKQVTTVEEDVDFPIEKIEDANRKVGYRKIKQQGEKGKRNVTYEIVMKDGVEVSRKEIASVTTKEPKKQVEVVGIKNNYSGSLNEWLLALRTCETHGNYKANTGNGYYGAYQFLPSTWNAIAKRTGRNDLVGILPHQANPADQDAMVIANANATSGLSTQHPGCYKKLGLSNKPPAQ
ncbi:hypothetical protein CR969_00615 [Candidatus Saccharibacteria bacterium]|nr:MAG: hypothetical protein CR969_00615 [Candidatus Saccharibacteria bacterium]